MDRGKPVASLGKRGTKSKSVSHLHGDLIALGSKSVSSENKFLSSQFRPGPSLSKSDKKNDVCTTAIAKKQKFSASTSGSSLSERVAISSTKAYQRAELDSWREVAIEPPPSSDLVAAVMDSDQARAEALLCGCVRWQLMGQRSRIDQVLAISLLLLVKCHPAAFCSEHVIAALCSLLRRDTGASSGAFKNRANGQAQVLAANLLCAVFRDENEWPEVFVSVYLEDSSGDRLWVDSEECRLFVDNIVTAFGTRVPPKALLQPDITLSGRPVECHSPTPTASSAVEEVSGDGSSATSACLTASSGAGAGDRDAVRQRYSRQRERVREITVEFVRELVGARARQPAEAVSRNILRLLASVTGVAEVRLCVVSRLEVWLQNAKWSRPAQELLVALCCNLTCPHQLDTEVIAQLVRFRLKAKPIISLYLNCIRELLTAHGDNLPALLKHTVYNELSQSRNPHNMAVLASVFQHSHQLAAACLADVFVELLLSKEDYYQRALRPLWREICRSLRYDIDLGVFCASLLHERHNDAVRSFEFRERYVLSVCELVALSILLSISPAVKECAGARGGVGGGAGGGGDQTALVAFHRQTAAVQLEVLKWLHVHVPTLTGGETGGGGWGKLVHCVYHVLFMEPADVYHGADGWPAEPERALLMRVACEVPAHQETLLRVMLIGLSKSHALQPSNALEVVENLARRSALCHVHTDGQSSLVVTNLDVIDLLFNLSVYQHPEGVAMPPGVPCPRLAVRDSYWRVWLVLLLITAHNPRHFGPIAWQHYDTLRLLIEMCITGAFQFPPPTVASGARAAELWQKERQLAAVESQQIVEYENVLAAPASTGHAITPASSLLLAQLITLEPGGPSRPPPEPLLDQLRQLNASLHVGRLLCAARQPDFLLDIVQRQVGSEKMPWLAELVSQSGASLHQLPVQCLCEFLLSELADCGGGGGSGSDEAPVDVGTLLCQWSSSQLHQQLLAHLRQLLCRPQADSQRACLELVEYLLRRLSCQRQHTRLQAVRGFQLLLHTSSSPPPPPAADQQQQFSWLLVQLPQLPSFSKMRQGAVHGLRIACHYETQPQLVGAYIQFLAAHSCDSQGQARSGQVELGELIDTVVDMAQLVVERSTVMAALLPVASSSTTTTSTSSGSVSGGEKVNGEFGVLCALLSMFSRYMRQLLLLCGGGGSGGGAGLAACDDSWPDSGDQVTVRWPSGVTCSVSALVLHATVILLCCPSPPAAHRRHYDHLMQLWFPPGGPGGAPQPVDTSAPLLPDWLKLRMVRSCSAQLVDSALALLTPCQLLLFIQSFGVPVPSMTKLLAALDAAVRVEAAAVLRAVLNRDYMLQLLAVQRLRGAANGHVFAAALRAHSHLETGGASGSDHQQQQQQAEEEAAAGVLVPAPVSRAPYSDAQPVTALAPLRAQYLVRSLVCPPPSSSCPSVVLQQQQQWLRAVLRSLALECRHQRPLLTEAVIAALGALLLPTGESAERRRDSCVAATGDWALSCLLRQLVAAPQVAGSAALCAQLGAMCGAARRHWSTRAPSSVCRALLLAVYRCVPSPARDPPPAATQVCRQRRVEPFALAAPHDRVQTRLQCCVLQAVETGCCDALVASLWTSLLRQDHGSGAGAAMGRVGLLVDWLELLEPDMLGAGGWQQARLSALFADGGREVKWRRHLLALMVHRADWSRLHAALHCLCSAISGADDRGAGGPQRRHDAQLFLDLLWCCSHVPRLWRGRDLASAESAAAAVPLVRVHPAMAAVVAECVVLEAAGGGAGSSSCAQQQQEQEEVNMDCLGRRLPLLLECLSAGGSRRQSRPLLAAAAARLVSLCSDTAAAAGVASCARCLLMLLYVKLPAIIALDPHIVPLLTHAAHVRALGAETCPLDRVTHTLLTAMCAQSGDKDLTAAAAAAPAAAAATVDGYELSLRKIAASHPLLLLRQLPLITALLRGRMHVKSSLFRQRNVASLMSRLLGLVELMMTAAEFAKWHERPVLQLLDIYLQTVAAHHQNLRELSVSGPLVCTLVSVLATVADVMPRAAHSLLAGHTDLLTSLSQQQQQQQSAGCPLLARLVAVACASHATTPAIPATTASYSPLSGPQQQWRSSSGAATHWATRIRCGISSSSSDHLLQQEESDDERLLTTLQELDTVSSRQPALLSPLCQDLCALSTRPRGAAGVRQLALLLLQRALSHRPAAGGRVASWLVRSFATCSVQVQSDVARHVPWLVLLAPEQAVPLLLTVFDAGLAGMPNAAQYISDALSAVNLQAGV